MEYSELEKEVFEDMIERLKYGNDFDDETHEVADSAIPIYTYDVLSVAQSNLWFATCEPELDTERTALAIIQANIFESLIEYLDENKDEIIEQACKELLDDFTSAFIEMDDYDEFIEYLMENNDHEELISNLVSQEQGDCTWMEDEYTNFNPNYKELD